MLRAISVGAAIIPGGTLADGFALFADRVHHSGSAAPNRGQPLLGVPMARVAIAGDFEPVAWWYTRAEIGRGLREYYGVADDLPPRLQLLVGKLDQPRSTWLTNLCVLAFFCAVLAASFRFHFVF